VSAPVYVGISGWQRYLLEVAHGARQGMVAAGVRALLRVGAALYRAGLEAYLLGIKTGLISQTRAGVPVVAIGNLTVGGTGKTTAVMAVARQLQAAGLRPAVLSRGYRGRGTGVVSDGRRVLMTAQQSGDEPWLLAQHLPGVPVLVGKDRRRTAALATAQLGANVLVLDDGFQYWRLHKDLELVLVDALNPFDNGRVLPAGMLREPIGHLHRAQAVWVTHADLADEGTIGEAAARIGRTCPGMEITLTRHGPVRLRQVGGGEVELEVLRGARVVALSGIGNPASFEATLERLGAEVVPARFPDHHQYRPQELQTVALQAIETGAAALVTTEKDEVRLPAWRGAPPLWVLGVEMLDLGGKPPLLSESLLRRLRER